MPVGVRGALEEVQERLRREQLRYTFAWPSRPERRRTYAYAFDNSNNACAFIKISEANETAALQNGFDMLQSVAQISHPLFKFPRAFAFGVLGNVCYHVSECVPVRRRGRHRRLRNISTQECIESYGGETFTVPPEKLETINWVQQFWRSINPSSQFAEVAREDQRMGVKCRRVHGDLTIANLIVSAENIWIIDWELSHPTGPWLTDVVTFFLGQRQRDLVKRPWRVLRQFRDQFIQGQSEERQRDVRFALMFLHGMKSGLGTALVNAWNAVD